MKLSRAVSFLLALVFSLSCLADPVDLAKQQSLTPLEAAKLRQTVIFLDVRTDREWKMGHVKGAIHIPHNRVAGAIEASIPDRSIPVVVYCASGGRAVSVIDTMRKKGYTAVPVLDGGYRQLISNGMESE